jgi:vitamin B12 transporter
MIRTAPPKTADVFSWLRRFLPLALPFTGMEAGHGASGDPLPVLPEVTVQDGAFQSGGAAPPGQTTRLSRTDLEAGETSDLNGLLRGLNGLIISQTNQGSPTGLSLRGAGGGAFGLVTLDGIPLFGTFVGIFPLSHFPSEVFDRLEVERGAGVLRNGSRTLGGAINLQTRRLADGQALVKLEGGSYGTLQSHLGGGIETPFGGLTAMAGRQDIFEATSQADAGDDKGERDPFQLTHGMLRWDKEFARGAFDGSLYFARSHESWDGPGLLPSGRLGWVDDKTSFRIDETWVAQGRGLAEIAPHWDSSLQIGFTQDRQQGAVGHNFKLPMDLTSQLWLARWQNAHRHAIGAGDAWRLTWGVEAQQQHAADLSVRDAVATYTVVSPLARGEISLGDWSGQAEARFDHNDRYGDRTVFAAGGAYRVRPDMSLWLKGGTGFRPPSVNERLHPVFGNPGLRPESAAGGEAGWRWRAGPGSELSLSGYYQRYEQLITLQFDSATGRSRAGNIPAVGVWGADAEARHAWTEDWSSGLSYSFMDARNLETRLKVPARPEHQGQFWNEWRFLPVLTFRVALTFRDGYFGDLANRLWLAPAPRLNALLKYQVSPNLQAYVRGENLNDERSPELYGFAFGGPAVYLGFRYQ